MRIISLYNELEELFHNIFYKFILGENIIESRAADV